MAGVGILSFLKSSAWRSLKTCIPLFGILCRYSIDTISFFVYFLNKDHYFINDFLSVTITDVEDHKGMGHEHYFETLSEGSGFHQT